MNKDIAYMLKFSAGTVVGAAMGIAMYDIDGAYLNNLFSGILIGLSMLSAICLNDVLRDSKK